MVVFNALNNYSRYPLVWSKLYNSLRATGMSHEEAMSDAASEMFDHMLAGLETTGITLTYLMYELSRRPELQHQFREEIVSVLANKTSNPSGDEILLSTLDVENLPFLNALVQETLRLYAAAPALQPRIVPSEGCTIEGHFIPGGMTVGSAAYVLHRDSLVFPNPFNFEPKRWIDSDVTGKGRGNEEMRRHFWAFGSGGRMCIGNNFALMLIKTVAVAVYGSFETWVVDDEGVEPRESYIASPKGEKCILGIRELAM
jgi:cytochrome P450